MSSQSAKHLITAINNFITFHRNLKDFALFLEELIWDPRAFERQKRYTWQIENMLRAVRRGDVEWAREHLSRTEGVDVDDDGGEFLEVFRS